jgi:hypothetical protein
VILRNNGPEILSELSRKSDISNKNRLTTAFFGVLLLMACLFVYVASL